MIYGVGVDLVDIDRVRRLLKKNESKFLSRCFTNKENILINFQIQVKD